MIIILLWERPTDERIQKDGLIARHVMGTMRSLADCQQTVDISAFSEILWQHCINTKNRIIQ